MTKHKAWKVALGVAGLSLGTACPGGSLEVGRIYSNPEVLGTAPENIQNSGPSASLRIETEHPCWVVLLAHKEIENQPYGWWSLWHKHKTEGSYFQSPHTFENVVPGRYVLIVHDPNNNNSDGVVLEEFEVKEFEARVLSFKTQDFVEWNCLSCPWLYVRSHGRFVRAFEVLEDVVGPESKVSRAYRLPAALLEPCTAAHRRVVIRIQEEKDEITFLHHLSLRVGTRLLPPKALHLVQSPDIPAAFPLHLRRGQALEAHFVVPQAPVVLPGESPRSTPGPLELVVSGYYEPELPLLEEAYQRLLRRAS